MKTEACAKGEQEGDNSEEDERMPAGDTDDSESVTTEREKEVKKTLPATTSENKASKLLQMPIGHQGWHVKRKMRRPIISDTSTRFQATAVY